MSQWKSGEEPLVSCCVVTYNHAPFLRKALDSLVMQETDFPFEIIIHDDCSTDGSTEIIREYAQRFPGLFKTVLQTENQFSKGINPFRTVMEMARGKYIARLETDDYWTDPHKLKRQVEFLEKHPKYVLCHHGFDNVNAQGELLSTERWGRRDYSPEAMLSGEVFLKNCTVMHRNVGYELPEIFIRELGADTVSWHLLGFYGGAKYLDTVGPSAYRIHSGGVWSSLDNVSRLKQDVTTRLLFKKNLAAHGINPDMADEAIAGHCVNHLANAIRGGEPMQVVRIVWYILRTRGIAKTMVVKRIVRKLFSN